MTFSAAIDDAANGLAVGVFPGLEPRLVIEQPGPETLEHYRSRGGYAPGLTGKPLIAATEKALLRGRGGAAFPFGVKLSTLAAQDGAKFAVANGEEGEPASIKDRWLMRKRPHLVLDGLFRAAETVGAAQAIVFVSDRGSASSLRRAVAELAAVPVPVTVHEVEPAYVAGEETSVVRAVNGGPAKPMDKPPRPFQKGVQDRPTLVSNVETLANLPFVAIRGADEFSEVGAGTGSPGTFLMTITGACERPGLYELPMGVPLGHAIEAVAGFQGKPQAFLMGGFFAGLLNRRALELELTYDRLRAAGSGLGCGAVVVIGADDCPVAAAADVMAYFARENANQCGACIRGTAAMSGVLSGLAAGTATPDAVSKLRGWSVSLMGRGACSLLDGAAAVAASLLREFPDEVEAHCHRTCPRCEGRMPLGGTTRFRVRELEASA